MWAGVPYAPVSPAYSTVSQDYDKLRHVLGTLTPGLVFAADGHAYRQRHRQRGAGRCRGGARQRRGHASAAGPQRARFDALLADAAPGRRWTPRCTATGPDTIAKFLFTSRLDQAAQGA